MSQNGAEENGKRSHEFLDFLLDKAYNSYIEAEKNVGQSLLTCLLLVSLEALLLFGKSNSGSDVTVPLLQLTLNRSYASLVILVLVCGASYWLQISLSQSRRFIYKVWDLIVERYDTQPRNWWYITHPTFRDIIKRIPVEASDKIKPTDAERAVKSTFAIIFLIANFLLPFVFLWFICINLQWPMWLRVFAFILLIILLLPSLLV